MNKVIENRTQKIGEYETARASLLKLFSNDAGNPLSDRILIRSLMLPTYVTNRLTAHEILTLRNLSACSGVDLLEISSLGLGGLAEISRCVEDLLRGDYVLRPVVAPKAINYVDATQQIKDDLNLRLSELNFSARVANCLKNDNLIVVADLIQKSATEMLRTPNLGRRALAEITEKIAQYGFLLDTKLENFVPENLPTDEVMNNEGNEGEVRFEPIEMTSELEGRLQAAIGDFIKGRTEYGFSQEENISYILAFCARALTGIEFEEEDLSNSSIGNLAWSLCSRETPDANVPIRHFIYAVLNYCTISYKNGLVSAYCGWTNQNLEHVVEDIKAERRRKLAGTKIALDLEALVYTVGLAEQKKDHLNVYIRSSEVIKKLIPFYQAWRDCGGRGPIPCSYLRLHEIVERYSKDAVAMLDKQALENIVEVSKITGTALLGMPKEVKRRCQNYISDIAIARQIYALLGNKQPMTRSEIWKAIGISGTGHIYIFNRAERLGTLKKRVIRWVLGDVVPTAH
jgi:RNA polymerase alpha subunit